MGTGTIHVWIVSVSEHLVTGKDLCVISYNFLGLFAPLYDFSRCCIFVFSFKIQFITARCTIVQSAVFRSHVICPSVCLSVTLVDHGHIG